MVRLPCSFCRQINPLLFLLFALAACSAPVKVDRVDLRTAYDELSTVPNTSPHARFDITDWVPLDP